MRCKTDVTVTIAHAPPIPATFVAAASLPPFVLSKSTVTVLVEVDVVVRVVVGSFDAIGVAARFTRVAEAIGSELAPAAKLAGAAVFPAGATEFPAAAAVALCM